MNEKDFENKKETYIDFLKSDAALQLNWAQKKEVAVWTAIVFYQGIIYTLFKIFIIDNETGLVLLHVIALLIYSLLFFLAITAFIWSNFQSIYNSHAYYNAVKKVINNIFYKNKIPSLKNTISKQYIIPNIIAIAHYRYCKTIQPCQTLWRPIKIVWYFLLNAFRIKRGKKYIESQLAKQEAVLYLLILIPTLFFWVWLLYVFFVEFIS